MTHLSLFTGIGGIDLAAEMAGFQTVGQVEIDDYCNRVLEYHWPDVPRWRDVKDVTAESFEERTGIKPGTLAVLSGGFPCQPVSCAGKRKGDTDERWLWDEMLRVICEIRPRWVLAENVRGLLSARSLLDGRHLFGRVLRDLAQNGYCAGWLCYGAGDVGAPHKRERVFIVVHSRGGGFGKQGICREQQRGAEAISTSEGSCWLVADTNNPGSRTPYGGTNENRSEEVKERGEQPQSRPCRFSQDVADAESTGNRRQQRSSGCGNDVCQEEIGAEIWGIVDNRYSLRGQELSDPDSPGGRTSCCGQDVANPTQHLLNRPRQTGPAGRGEFADGGAGPTQPRLGDFADGLPSGLAGHRWPAGPGPQHPWEPPRIATGVKDRVAKLKALGNAVVPAQAYPIFRAIRETEEAII